MTKPAKQTTNLFGFSRFGFIIAVFVAGIILHASCASAGCPPDSYQSIFTGTVWGIKMKPNDELRAYLIEEKEITTVSVAEMIDESGEEKKTPEVEYIETYLGSTNDNPGRLQLVNDRIEFGLYICGDSGLNGKELTIRYARGSKEYNTVIMEGDAVVQGRIIEIGIPTALYESKLSIKVTSRIGDDEEDSGEPLRGDINNDGRVDSDDAALVLHQVLFGGDALHQVLFGEDIDTSKYDVNGDGRINQSDVQEVYLIMRGISSSTAEATAADIMHHILFVGGVNDSFDINKDGRVDEQDIRALYRGNAEETDSGPIEPADILHYILFVGGNDGKYDVNDDGKVNSQDIQALFLADNSPEEDEPLTAANVLHYVLFVGGSDSRYDINKDGRVDEKDARILFCEEGGSSGSIQLTATSVLRHVLYEGGIDLRYDVNHDNVVNLEDVRALYTEK
ncbi:MAG: dockerin type I domain-containing protein [Thermodesulfobacteriota bacterium]|nr:dockerin type I domain-containing protein [Thermodesulfobacteriota bacterium]